VKNNLQDLPLSQTQMMSAFSRENDSLQVKLEEMHKINMNQNRVLLIAQENNNKNVTILEQQLKKSNEVYE
jgi:hypothetical protein